MDEGALYKTFIIFIIIIIIGQRMLRLEVPGKRGGPEMTFIDVVREDMRAIGVLV